jgi:protein arginine N-methyltransferase 1
MILDVPRMEAYVRALRAAISPGCVVADIGAGTGIFAMLACQARRARRVFAVDPNPAIDVARQIAAANGFADRIEFFEALSTRIELPERADVIVSDLRGILPSTRSTSRRSPMRAGATSCPAGR